jgi:hypothetical protein
MISPHLFLLPLLCFFGGAGARALNANAVPATVGTALGTPKPMSDHLRIRIGTKIFTATLRDNPTAAAFKARLPLTISMNELNGNEKFYHLPESLPAKAANPGTIHAGDLMLYGTDTVVLFYQTFATPYTYTRLGQLDNPAGLAAALGVGSATVTFELP